MLGEQIEDLRGKITGQRVVDIEPITMETTVSSSGNIKGIQVTQILTFVGRPKRSEEEGGGIIHGKGVGITMAAQQSEEVATFTGEAVGRISSSGSTKWRGSIFYSTSKGRLSFLNNMILVFESEINAEGNFAHKSWEWK
ncbi:MAG TPA: hypothetical protein VE643_04565 [Nitrososphaeraceae archaeon]|nr:hypothetical protein [Nitrososphaeraceae archaeon]